MLKLLVALICLTLGVGILWGASELHYRSCVDSAKVRGRPGSGLDAKLDAIDAGDKRPPASKLVAGCSRLPW
jgi:hypothetical protein